MNEIKIIADLLSEIPGKITDLARVKIAASKSNRPELYGPRTHGSQIMNQEGNPVGLFSAIEGHSAEVHNRDEFSYLVFPIKKGLRIEINAVPSYLVPRSSKVQIAISPKGTPQVVADGKILGYMEPSGELVVILRHKDKFITWFPISDGEEPWNMTALKNIDEHLHLARAGINYNVSELESYLGGSFNIVRKSDVLNRKHKSL